MIRSSYIKTAAIEISDVVKTTPDGVVVIVKDTGKRLCLPRRHVDFMPGLAIIPTWLFDKIYVEATPNRAAPSRK